MKLELGDRRQLVLKLLVADLLARPGRGPLARPDWPRRARPLAAQDPAPILPPSAAETPER